MRGDGIKRKEKEKQSSMCKKTERFASFKLKY